MTFLGRASLAVMMALGAAGAVRAQSPSDQGSTPVCRTHGQDEKRSEDGCWTFNLQVENDSVFGGADRHYTNGMRLTLVSPESTAYFDFMRETSEKVALTREAYLTRFSYGFGQNMYTPTEIRTTTPDPKDRPYAGWLYLSTGFVTYPADLSRTEGWKIMNAAELEIGVVGPAAKADITQKEWHELVNAPEPKGWSHQLKNEPGLAIYYEAQARSPKKTLVGDFSADIAPSAGVALGNVYDYVGAGATLRFGFSLPDDYGPPRIRPGLPGSAFFIPDSAVSFYLFGGFEQRWMGRNIFLDGNTWRSSPSVDSRPFVNDGFAGFQATWRGVRLAYNHVWRSPEFEGQHGRDQFSSVTLSCRFPF